MPESNVIIAQVRRVGATLNTLHARLTESGFLFDNPDEVLPGPHDDTERILTRISNDVGPVPLCIATFWREVGSVDFCGYHPEWDGCDYPDPIVIFPPTVGESELREYHHDPQDYVRAFGSFRIPIAPDHYHKEDESGGMWYGIAIPDTRDDVPLLEERHETTFLKYLNIALNWAGFPGLEYTKQSHNWPIADLTRSTKAT